MGNKFVRVLLGIAFLWAMVAVIGLAKTSHAVSLPQDVSIVVAIDGTIQAIAMGAQAWGLDSPAIVSIDGTHTQTAEINPGAEGVMVAKFISLNVSESSPSIKFTDPLRSESAENFLFENANSNLNSYYRWKTPLISQEDSAIPAQGRFYGRESGVIRI